MGTNTYHVHIPIHSQRLLIDTIAKYVSNYGKPFEDELIARIVFGDDARYNFLVNEGTPENVYYKWKVYSLCQGDEINSWCTDPYWIFKGGSKWIPPHNLRSIDRVNYSTKAHGAKNLPTEARQLLIDKIAKISSKRSSIRDTMIYIIEHSDYALDVSNILIDSIINSEIDVSTKINRIYLLNDVLHNSSSCTKPSSWVYRNAFEKRLPEIFDHFSKITYKSGKIARGLIIEKLYTLVKIWESWSIFSTTFTKALEFTILSDHIDVIEPIKPPINLLNSLLDGRELNGCEVLLKLPQTYRKFAYVGQISFRNMYAFTLISSNSPV
ncbi:U2-associated protein SR140 [Babesia microti strain RI]|uniref:U2-associated protein SR140 n=1 Tax=Babesia microti (strain RI) TaxID=1133968 RepID=I7ISE5_BABMR|nr:U2-associated protein SR140 [Babesia microti strain RI]CCF75581.2 U2-associated protein SR140 [Babesia microti strain RI]|eukprot:XP_021337189.1 U2-associated protein SR140 [Babesia microti strain RI]